MYLREAIIVEVIFIPGNCIIKPVLTSYLYYTTKLKYFPLVFLCVMRNIKSGHGNFANFLLKNILKTVQKIFKYNNIDCFR